MKLLGSHEGLYMSMCIIIESHTLKNLKIDIIILLAVKGNATVMVEAMD